MRNFIYTNYSFNYFWSS